MPKTILYLSALTLLFFTNNIAFAIDDCKNVMGGIDAEIADQLKIAKISLSCDSKDKMVCKQGGRSFSCEAVESKLNENPKIFIKYHLPNFIEDAKWNTPSGYQKKLQSKPIYLSKKETKSFCTFIETKNNKPCKDDTPNYEPRSRTVNDLWYSFIFTLDPKQQAYVYAYETTSLKLSGSCDLASNDPCVSSSDSSISQDLMKKSRLLSIIKTKK